MPSRCDFVLENRCQCPNNAVDGSTLCKLHKTLEEHKQEQKQEVPATTT